MMRCLRIFGAYTYRLSRKHSTIILIALFMITVTVILHLYAYKHQDTSPTFSRVGDFEYRPAAFLKGKQPIQNISYCQFNYGLPDELQWKDIQIYTTPEEGSASAYRVIYNIIQGSAYVNHSSYNAVTYATQATPEFIYHIVEIARFWSGPVSLAVFVPNYDLDIVIQIMKQLCHCYEGMSKVSVHIFYPKRYPPKLGTYEDHNVVTKTVSTTAENITVDEVLKQKWEKYKNLNGKTRAEYIEWVRKKKIERMIARQPKQSYWINLQFPDCAGMISFDIPTFRRVHNMVYPINVARNVARNASKTNYFIVSDIELVPSDGLAPKFLNMVRKLMGDKKRDDGCIFAKTVFVVPLFEVEKGEEIPHDKDALVRMVTDSRAKYFHQKLCPHCQRFPGLQSWLLRPAPSVIEPMLIARREYPYHRWEPLYFGTQNEPWYSELLSWEGRQDKMTQMLEMCLQGYRMVVLDGGFLCHAAAVGTKSGSNHYKAKVINRRRYQSIVAGFKQRYPDRPKCKIMWGCNK